MNVERGAIAIVMRDERGITTKAVIVVLAALLLGAGIGIGAAKVLGGNDGNPITHQSGKNLKVSIPAADFQQNTWGYLGCSNTHDAIFGYHQVPDSAQLFWPFEALPTEYMTVKRWTNPQDRHWQRFDFAKQRQDHGQDPPVVWVQLCQNLDPSSGNYSGHTTFDQVAQLLSILKQHAPTAIVFISPLQAYDPPTLCSVTGPNGDGIAELTDLANEAVDKGLAYPGPGAKGNPELGPLTPSLVVRDNCHPSGGPHGPGPGAEFLGKQLVAFFDHLPKS